METVKEKTTSETYKNYLQDNERFLNAPRTTQWRMKKRKLTQSSETQKTETVENRPQQSSLNDASGANGNNDFDIPTPFTVPETLDDRELLDCEKSENEWVCPVVECRRVLSRKQTLKSHLSTVHNLTRITKKFLTLWFDNKSANQSYYFGNQIKEVDKIMKSITPPYLIKRLPRKLSNTMHHWKASELRSWLLFYALPCLSGKLPNLYLKHFSTVVKATYILLGEGITEVDLLGAEMLLNSFVKTTDKLYAASVAGLNVHNLLHLCECVRKWGPIWAWSCFSFESFNGEIKKSVHGTGNVCRQIFWSLRAQKRMENISTMPVWEDIKAFVASIRDGKSDSSTTVSAQQCLVKTTIALPEN